jgi:hypothetical protein
MEPVTCETRWILRTPGGQREQISDSFAADKTTVLPQ